MIPSAKIKDIYLDFTLNQIIEVEVRYNLFHSFPLHFMKKNQFLSQIPTYEEVTSNLTFSLKRFKDDQR